MDNLDILKKYSHELNQDDTHAYLNYLIGALSVHINQKTWTACCYTAATSFPGLADKAMTNNDISRDPYTMKHLNAWLDNEINGDDCRDEVKAAMLSLYDDDPEYWGSQSWWNLFDKTNCNQILDKYR